MTNRKRKITTTSLLVATLASTSAPLAVALTEADATVTKPAGESGRQEVTVNHSELESAVKQAKDAGLDITRAENKVRHSDSPATELKAIEADEKAQADSIRKAVADYQASKAQADKDNKAKLDAWEAEQSRLEAENKKAREEAEATNKERRDKYEAELKAWEAKNAENEKLRKQQENGDPYTAQTPDRLFNEQPFDFNEGKNSIARVTSTNARELGESTANYYDSGNIYNSEKVVRFQVNKDSTITVEYGNVATDRATGKPLNATVTYSNFHMTAGNVNNAIYGIPAEALNTTQIFSNFLDAAAIQGITKVDVTTTLKWADTGENYDMKYYYSIGSLHGVKDIQIGLDGRFNPNIPADPTGHYEFAAPGRGVLGTFVTSDSMIPVEAQNIYSHEGVIGRGFMIRQGTDYYFDNGRTSPIGDTSEEAMTKLGVTFLVENGATISVGVSSAVEGRDYDNDVNWYNGGPIGYNHVMFSARTVAPVIPLENKPKEPEYVPVVPEYKRTAPPVAESVAPPVLSYYLNVLTVDGPSVEKVAVDEGKYVLPGESTTQTVTTSTGHLPLTKFGIGDNIFFTEDGRLPVSVDLKDIRVTTGGQDVTDQFTITAEDVVFKGRKAHQVLALAKNPGALPQDTEYTLHIKQTALDDGFVDKEVDAGFSYHNDTILFTDDKTYNEVTVTPEKDVLNKAGEDVDGRTALPGTDLNYKVTLKGENLDKATTEITRFGVTDDYDESKWEPTKDKATVTTLSDEDVTDQFTFAWDEKAGKVTVLAKEPQKTVGQDYLLNLPGKVKEGATGTLENTAVQLVNDLEKESEKVVNEVPPFTPEKSVLDSEGKDINERVVLQGDQVNYDVTLDASEFKNLTETPELIQLIDDYDETKWEPVKEELKVVAQDGSDATGLFTVEWDEQAGKVTVTAKNPAEVAGQDYTLKLPGVVKKDATAGELLNTAEQVVNTTKQVTRTVVNSIPSFDPHKEVQNTLGVDIDGKTVMRGDIVDYKLTLDASELKDTVYQVKALGLNDTYDKSKWEPLKDKVSVQKVTEGGLESFDMSVFTVEWDDEAGSFQIRAKNPAEVVGADYVFSVPGLVLEKAEDGVFENTAEQVVNDYTTKTETVRNEIVSEAPEKDVVVSADDETSINEKTLAQGTVFAYELNSKVLRADRGTVASQWSIADRFDTSRVEVTGNFKVENQFEMVLADGSVLAEGSDITRFFSAQEKDGEWVYSASEEFLALANSEANRSREFGFQVYAEVKALDVVGKVENTFVESFNQVREESNLVWNDVPARDEPVVPGKPGEPAPAPAPAGGPAGGFSAQTGGFAEGGFDPASVALVATGATLVLGSGGAYVWSRRRKG